jgi:hypothetical protein
MAKTLKPGQRASRSGVYEIVGPRGGGIGKERTVVRGGALPPTPKSGQSYTLHTKSGRSIITSPAKSANTRMSWSKAFKK